MCVFTPVFFVSSEAVLGRGPPLAPLGGAVASSTDAGGAGICFAASRKQLPALFCLRESVS